VTISDGLRQCLLDDPAIFAKTNTRIYPLRLPQNPVLPAIVLHRVTGVRYPHLRGGASIARPLFQVDSWEKTYDGATALGSLVRQRLEGYLGQWTDGMSPPVIVTDVKILFLDERDDFQPDILGGSCRHSSDYHIYHSTSNGLL
jgi:Protein of unknown function (DUF3168)